MLKSQSLIKAIRKYRMTFDNKQYQSWKWHNYTQWADLSFRPLIIMQIIFIIIKLSTVANNTLLWIIFGAQIFVHFILFSFVPKIIYKESKFLQIVPLIQQECFCILCYFVLNESYLMFYTAICVIFQSMYSTILCKLFALAIFFIQTFFLSNISSFEGLYLTLSLMIMQIIRKELQQLQHFINLQALFLIIDSTPQAMCIAHKDKNWLLYSNKVFDNLAQKLESTNQSETDQSPEKTTSNNLTKNQLTFLQNLQLDELNNNQKSAQFDLDDDDLYIEDQYKIKNVIYSKDKNTIQSSRAFFYDTPTDRPKNHVQFQKFFQSFKNPEDESIIKKTFTSDVAMKIEVNNPPQQHLTSAGKKSPRKKSNIPNIKVPKPYMTPSRKISADCLLNSKENRSSGHKQSLLDQEGNLINKTKPIYVHKMKFLINVLENCKFFDNDDELQIYFIHEVNQILLRAKLKKLESIKKNLLRSISHELLTNFNAVFGFIKQSQDRLLKQESCHLQLEQALSYTKLQLYKIYDFFDYRDILEDSFQLKQDKFDINTVILECVDLFRNQIERKSLLINVELPETSQIISGDRQRLCQVILNLIGNSIRFTYQGGISIIVQKQEYIESMVGIDVNSAIQEDNNNLIEVQVNDTGIGMTEDELSILRKKLHLTDEDEKVSKHSVGIGLGLSVSKQIIKLMAPKNQNYLSVESIKDEGTRFNFLLNYYEESNQNSNFLQRSNNHTVPFLDAQSTQQVRVMNYNKCNNIQITDKVGQSEMQIDILLNSCNCKIALIVDDEEFNIEVLSHMVKQLGFEIDSAFNGKQALEKVQTQLLKRCNQFNCVGYNCILMDINMPMMNGWETVQRIRQIENEIHLTRTIPVIAVTGFCSIKDQQKSINEGFNSVLIKPATKEKLIETFNRLQCQINIHNIYINKINNVITCQKVKGYIRFIDQTITHWKFWSWQNINIAEIYRKSIQNFMSKYNRYFSTLSNLQGIDFKIKKIQVDDKVIKMQIWDTAGQERYQTITQTYYKGAMGIILVFAVNDQETFNDIDKWMNQIKQHASDNIIKVLIGNKTDLPDRCITYDQALKLAQKYNIPYFETSAKDGININDTFLQIAKLVKEQTEKLPQQQNRSFNKLSPTQNHDQQKQDQPMCC
ncbi:unnamed protein product [Paramecium sonneborni]|uniref:Uncharacterized protein n=1 Tax=Paramecium sonneborni TaxID=65129 RepID=A0A8S1RC73_9CILI|nr:unnamed protein product [Paramecium sonneborni]